MFSSFQIDFNVRRTVDELSGGLFGEEKEMEEVENVNLPLREEEPRVWEKKKNSASHHNAHKKSSSFSLL